MHSRMVSRYRVVIAAAPPVVMRNSGSVLVRLERPVDEYE